MTYIRTIGGDQLSQLRLKTQKNFEEMASSGDITTPLLKVGSGQGLEQFRTIVAKNVELINTELSIDLKLPGDGYTVWDMRRYMNILMIAISVTLTGSDWTLATDPSFAEIFGFQTTPEAYGALAPDIMGNTVAIVSLRVIGNKDLLEMGLQGGVQDPGIDSFDLSIFPYGKDTLTLYWDAINSVYYGGYVGLGADLSKFIGETIKVTVE